MKLTKFERRRQELIKRQEKELRDLVEQEKKELEKMVEPVVEKIAKVSGEEARKLLEKKPELLENYTFRKREAARAISEALQKMFEGDEAGPGDDASAEKTGPGGADAGATARNGEPEPISTHSQMDDPFNQD